MKKIKHSLVQLQRLPVAPSGGREEYIKTSLV